MVPRHICLIHAGRARSVVSNYNAVQSLMLRFCQAINAHNYPDIDTNEQPYSPILHYCQAYEPEYYDKHYVWSKYQINFGIAQVNSGRMITNTVSI